MTAAAPPNQLLKEQAYRGIKSRLLSEEYAPGSFLSERQLAFQLGMSKTPVKAALERLEQEGLIAVSPQQGIVVRELAIREVAEQYEIRIALESFVHRTIAGKLTNGQLRQVQDNLDAQKKILTSHDMNRAVELDMEFHMLFVQFQGNREIHRVISQLHDKMIRVIRQVFRISPSRFAKSYEEHCEIAEAVKAGQGNKAATVIQTHLERGRQLIIVPSS